MHPEHDFHARRVPRIAPHLFHSPNRRTARVAHFRSRPQPARIFEIRAIGDVRPRQKTRQRKQCRDQQTRRDQHEQPYKRFFSLCRFSLHRRIFLEAPPRVRGVYHEPPRLHLARNPPPATAASAPLAPSESEDSQALAPSPAPPRGPGTASLVDACSLGAPQESRSPRCSPCPVGSSDLQSGMRSPIRASPPQSSCGTLASTSKAVHRFPPQ